MASSTVRVDSNSDEYEHQIDEETDVLEQADSGVTMRPADSEVIQSSVDIQQDAAAAAAADDDDEEEEEEDDDDECDADKAQPREHIAYQRDTPEEQSQDDANVDDVQRKIQSSESEATEVCVQADSVESGDSDQEKLDKECQTFCDTTDHQCQTLEQQYQLFDEQCQPLKQHSQALHVHHHQCQQWTTSDQHRQVLDLPSEASDQEQRHPADQSYQNVDQECQTLYEEHSNNAEMNNRQSETNAKDVQCQTTQLNSRHVQTDSCDMTVIETLDSATETDFNQRQQATTRAVATCDTQLLQVAFLIALIALSAFLVYPGLYLTGGLGGLTPPARGSWPPRKFCRTSLGESTLTPLRTPRFHFLAKPVYLCTTLRRLRLYTDGRDLI